MGFLTLFQAWRSFSQGRASKMRPFNALLGTMPAAMMVTDVCVASAVAVTSGSDLHPLSEN
eukprot:5271750-Pyramimonas_sp.AAC.1